MYYSQVKSYLCSLCRVESLICKLFKWNQTMNDVLILIFTCKPSFFCWVMLDAVVLNVFYLTKQTETNQLNNFILLYCIHIISYCECVFSICLICFIVKHFVTLFLKGAIQMTFPIEVSWIKFPSWRYSVPWRRCNVWCVF